MSFVGLDVGGTFLKAAILTRNGEVGPVSRVPVPDFLDTSGRAREIDPEALLRAVSQVVASVAVGVEVVEGILVTGQMAGIAFVDAAGAAVAPLISWQDSRARDVDSVSAALGPEAVADLGDGLRTGLPVVTLVGLGIPEQAFVTSLISYVAGSLCGRRAGVVHVTDAAAWGMYDLRHGRWSESALTLLGLAAPDVPSVSRALESVGLDQGLGTPVFCPVGDQQASLLGAGLRDGVVSVNLATGCQVSVLSDSMESPVQLRPFFDNRYLHTVTHLPAGRLLTAAIREGRGSADPEDWAWAATSDDSCLAAAVEVIAGEIGRAVHRLGAEGRPVLFSGGLVQRFAPVRKRIVELLAAPFSVYPGDDSALAGLGLLAAQLASRCAPRVSPHGRVAAQSRSVLHASLDGGPGPWRPGEKEAR